MQQLEPDCADVRLKRYEPEAKAEADAVLSEAVSRVEDSIARDFEPAFKGGKSDCAVLAEQIKSEAAASAPGVRHHALVEAALRLNRRRSRATRRSPTSAARSRR